MKIRNLILVFVAMAAMVPSVLCAAGVNGKKVLLIDSYHEGYPWSDGVVKGVKDVIGTSGADLKVIRMDTKRNKGDDFNKEAALKVKAEIESYKPDVVIAADDNASKYVVMPYYKDADLPIVFCGVNWTTTEYGYPYKNTTGMIEVSLAKEVVKKLSGYAKGNRIGYLSSNSKSSIKEATAYKETLGMTLTEEIHAATFAEWKDGLVAMQNKVDILVIGNHSGINDWNEEEAAAWAFAKSKIPSGTVYDFEMPYAMFGLTKVAEEQGVWSGKTALKILGGASPSSIPVVKNQKGKMYINVKIATKAGVTFSIGMVKNAEIIK